MRHVEEAIASVRSSPEYLSELGLTIVADQPEQVQKVNVFDQVIEHTDVIHSFRNKIPSLLSLPYDLTLFLDSDRFSQFGEWLESHPASTIGPSLTHLFQATHS